MDKNITVADLKILIESEEEYKDANIQGAILIPLNELATKLSQYDQSKKYVVHCRSGRRSLEAQKIMQERGFHRTLNLLGGMDEWIEKKQTIRRKKCYLDNYYIKRHQHIPIY
jgi:rhodanese-related sulfurtransferase